MLTCARIVVLVLVLAARAGAEPGVIILDPREARGICRGMPIQRYWRAQEDDVRAVEALVPDYVARLGRPSAPLAEYHRQYLGILVGDRRLIYVNFFHRSYLGLHPRLDAASATELVCVMDGGESYWSVLYDPGRREPSSPEFNGEA